MPATSGQEPAVKLHYSLQATRLVHERLATIMSYAYSQGPLASLVEARFRGEFKYLRRALFEIPVKRAERALIELGLYIRVIDDAEGTSKAFDNIPMGYIVHEDGHSKSELLIREVANKIIHGERFEWDVSGEAPTVTSFANASQRKRFKWSKASIDLVKLSMFCGSLAS